MSVRKLLFVVLVFLFANFYTASSLSAGFCHFEYEIFKMLSQDQLKELKELYLQTFGVVISDQEAIDYSETLLKLLTAVYKPVK